jgi:hypothetical protein
MRYCYRKDSNEETRDNIVSVLSESPKHLLLRASLCVLPASRSRLPLQSAHLYFHLLRGCLCSCDRVHCSTSPDDQ